ncbi:MAG: acyl-CoA dehydrogenase family protein [Oligoflexia bacterium]|nr:acyl-CoA dehydrogenase family protein [Oligoflexia bacterium]
MDAHLKNLDLFNPSEEFRMLRSTVRNFTREEVEPQALSSDRKEYFNTELFKHLGGLGLLGITVPETYGGAGLDALAAVIVHEELSASDPGFCLAFLAHALLCANNIAANASEEQKRRYLPKLCSGEWIGAMGLSEPGVGTDVLGMTTTAQKQKDGYVLNGRKMWITNGTVDDKKTPCDVLLLYARDGASSEDRSISTFIIERGFSGFSVGQKITDKLGMRASNTAELCFDNCSVPLQNLVGREGESLTHMMRNLEIERLGLAAMSLGIARRSIEVMVTYANEREAFGKKLTGFGQVQRLIAESYSEYQAARAYVYNTARKIDLHKAGQRLDSDGVKLFASRIGKQIAERAIQVLGGYGYVGAYVVERLWRDAKLLEIGGGTSEAHQKNICADLARISDLSRVL